MKKKLFLLTIPFLIQAQHKSIHQIESEYYSDNPVKIHESEKYNSIELNKASKVNKTIFGYLPYWEYSRGSHFNLKYNLLTHLAVFSFEADANGNLKEPPGWPWSAVTNAAASNNVKLIMCVTNFSGNDVHGFFTDQTKQKNLITNILNTVGKYNFNGVNIDFESLKIEDRGQPIGDFAKALRTSLLQMNSTFELSFALPVINWSGWNFAYISQFVDHIFIMGYDFYGRWSTNTGPSSPLIGTYSLTRALQIDYNSVVSSSPNKLILGVPYYGNYWLTKSKDPFTPVDTSKLKREWVKSMFYRDVIPAYESKEKVWDNNSLTPWIRWQETTWNQIWYDDEKSLELKYNLALDYKLGGIGIWALGYDNGRSELWNLIEKKFATTELNENQLPSTFQLYQNYPNPFNPSTTIKYTIPTPPLIPPLSKERDMGGVVTLKIYDLLGREVATLVDEFKNAGTYSSSFSPSSGGHSFITSGIYFYTLRAGNFTQTKKMVLIR